MRKYLAIIFGLMIFSAAKCFAAIDADGFYLGGLTLEKSMNEVTEMYGKASRVEKDNRLTFYYFGDESFCVVEFANRIFAIYSNDQNKIETPDGITVGMDEHFIEEVYGKPEGKTEQSGLTTYSYNKIGRKYEELKFSVRNGKVVGITLHYNI